MIEGKKKKIAHFGAFNHDSFGDLIFPHIAEKYLPDFQIINVAPTSHSTIWQDQKAVISSEEAFQIKDWDGVLIGGGDLIHSPENFIWTKTTLAKMGSIPSLWCGASLFSSKLGIPCAWNSPGVPFNLFKEFKSQPHLLDLLSKEALNSVNHISVRDQFSKNNLSTILNKKINIRPDSALLVSDLWKKKIINEEYVALSLIDEDLFSRKNEIIELISLIKGSKKLPSNIVILPLMAWKGQNNLEDIKSRFDIKVLDRSLSLKECALTIGGSSAYLGNSLHGLITAVSYQTPAVIVKPIGFENVFKYEGFASHFPGSNFVANNFNSAFKIIDEMHTFETKSKKEEVIENFKDIEKVFKSEDSYSYKLSNWNELLEENKISVEKLILHGIDFAKVLYKLKEESYSNATTIHNYEILKNNYEILKIDNKSLKDEFEEINKVSQKQISDISLNLEIANSYIETLIKKIVIKKNESNNLLKDINSKNEELNNIKKSFSWKILQIFRKIKNFLIN